MGKNDEKPGIGGALEPLATIGVAAITGLNPVAAAAAPVALGFLARAFQGSLSKAADERTNRWLQDISAAHRFSGDPDRVRQELDASIDEQWARDTLVESFRQLMSLLDEKAVPVIAALT